MLRAQSTVDNAAQKVTGMDVIAQTEAPENRETEHASSTQRDHVSRETRRLLRPTTSSACLSHVRWGRTLLPFTSSSCAAREPGEDLKRGDAAGLPSVAMMRAAQLLQGDTGELASGGPDANRLSSSARGIANDEIDAGTTRIHTTTHHQVPIASLGFT